MKYPIRHSIFMTVAACCALGLAVAGCGSSGGGTAGTASATFVLTNDSLTTTRDATEVFTVTRGTTSAPVPVDQIESLTVTVTEIVLQRCGPGDDEEGADELETVLVEDFEFDPMSVTIEQGGTVRWVWTTDTFHTITSGMPGDMDAGSLFDESAMDAGTVIELIFADTGIFPYFSDTETDIAEGMVGNVNVVPEDDTNGDDDGDDNGDNGEGGLVTIFTGSFDVELKDLSMLAQVLNEEEFPAGRYCKIRIRIENPRLVLASDPTTELTNVKLTANGRLFIQDPFDVEPGEELLILINFGGLHLIDAGASGMFVLTPQVRADVDVAEAEVEVEGVIISKDDEADIIEIRTPSDDVFEVFVTGMTTILTDDDSDDAAETRGIVTDVMLTFDDLAVDQNVDVEGTLMVGNQITADVIEVADEDIDTTMLDGGGA